MIISKVILAIMEEQGMTQASLGRELDVSRQALNQRLKRDSMRTNELIDILEVLGYDLVIQPKDSRLEKGALKIERGK